MDILRHRLTPWRSRCAVFALLALSCCTAGAGMAGKPAPPLAAVDLQQRPVNLADLHGKTVLLMFWATWCVPCRKEMPIVQTAYEKYRNRGFAVIAVNVSDDREDVEAYTRKMGINLPFVLDPDGSTAERFGVIGLPTNYVIDGEGIVRDIIIGGGLGAERLAEIIDKSRLSAE